MKTIWRVLPMGQLCSIQSGKSDTKDAVPDGLYAFFDRSKTVKRSNRYLRDCEALIIPGEGSEFLPRHFNGRFDLHQRAYALFDFSRDIDVRFLFHYLHHVADYFPRVAVGATVKSLRLRHFEQLLVVVPPFAEQQRIVAILDEAFAGIATACAAAEQNRQNARALFESHLHSVFSQRQTGWEQTTLEKVLSLQPQNGWSPPAAHHADSGVPVLTLSSVTGFQFRPEKTKFTSAPTSKGRSYWVNNGDFLITRSNTPELVGHVAIAEGIERPTIYPDLIMRMKPLPERMLTEFLYYQMRSPALRKEITGRAQGANPTMKKISNGAVRTLPILVPSLAIQRVLVNQLNDLTLKTQRLESLYQHKLDALDELKQALLYQAFNGELTPRAIDYPLPKAA